MSEQEFKAQTKFVLLQGGIVQNDLDIPVYDLDALYVDVVNEVAVSDLIELIANIHFDGNYDALDTYVGTAAEVIAGAYFAPGSRSALSEIVLIREGLDPYGDVRYDIPRVEIEAAIEARRESLARGED